MFEYKKYFSHDFNARNDIKIRLIKKEFGAAGYAYYFIFLELLGSQLNNYRLDLNSKSQVMAVLMEMDLSNNEFDKFINYCLEIDLLKKDGSFIYSKKFTEHMEYLDDLSSKKSKGGKKSAEAKKTKAELELLKQEGKRLDAEAQMLENQQSLSKPNYVTQINSNHSINNADSVENSFPTQINKFDIDESFFLNQRYSGNQEELINDKIIALNDYLTEDKQITMAQMQSWIQRHKTEKVLTVLNSMYEISQYIKSTNAVKLVSFVKKVLDGNGELSGQILQKKEVNVIEIEEKKIERLYNDYHELFVLYMGSDYKAKKLCYMRAVCDLVTEIGNDKAKLSMLKEMYDNTEILAILKLLMEQEETKKNLYIFMLTVNGQIRPTQMGYEKAFNYIKELIESN